MASADERNEAWEAWKASPWGRLRFALIGDAIDEAIAEFGDRTLRILDVGGADGFETLPYAIRGHQLTVADPAEGFFDRGREAAEQLGVSDRVRWVSAGLEELPMAGDTAYDVVVCHFVLHYRPAGSLGADVATLSRLTAPDGVISIACPNEAGLVLRTLTREGPAAARAELDETTQFSHTFGHDSQKVGREEVAAALHENGLVETEWMGVRIANDLIVHDEMKHDPVYFQQLLALERDLCRRDPYRGIAALWQLTAKRL
ncbi:S-adenosylmethionine-dependent methyltransferase [Janibacter sp. HTCC2649]|uniref:methyltransferase domain-containing protein n=1 Tax=Janibacter sp. HTCC2649 TaxID=313589 RepID=UPI000066EC93|nr:methyltransferase domain-containing protein [Janibacter sp. HTCC2649]EAP99310.1 S-adenosylmethionine-dependent methyltransferase [Janibacter sp. HTCC2649]